MTPIAPEVLVLILSLCSFYIKCLSIITPKLLADFARFISLLILILISLSFGLLKIILLYDPEIIYSVFFTINVNVFTISQTWMFSTSEFTLVSISSTSVPVSGKSFAYSAFQNIMHIGSFCNIAISSRCPKHIKLLKVIRSTVMNIIYSSFQ